MKKWTWGGDKVTLYLGDARRLLRKIRSNSIDLVMTDPPFGHNNNNNGDLISRREAALGRGDYVPEENNRPIVNDGEEADPLFYSLLPSLSRVLVPGGNLCCCCGGGGPDPQFARWSLWLDEVFEFKQMIVWDKGPIGMGWHYRRSYETVLVASKKGSPYKWYSERADVENILRPGDYGIRKIIPAGDQHPTEKPVELAEHFISLHTEEGDTVLDPFVGHGAFVEACVRLNRKCIGFEIEGDFYNYTKARIKGLQVEENREPPTKLKTRGRAKRRSL